MYRALSDKEILELEPKLAQDIKEFLKKYPKLDIDIIVYKTFKD